MTYTIEEIEEMRKRLPFKAVVWFGDFESESVVRHIFDDGRCANNKGVWESFKEIKEPEYVPFTIDDFKEFAGKWIVDNEGDYQMITRFNNIDVHVDNDISSYKEALERWKFADTGKPFGREVQQ